MRRADPQCDHPCRNGYERSTGTPRRRLIGLLESTNYQTWYGSHQEFKLSIAALSHKNATSILIGEWSIDRGSRENLVPELSNDVRCQRMTTVGTSGRLDLNCNVARVGPTQFRKLGASAGTMYGMTLSHHAE